LAIKAKGSINKINGINILAYCISTTKLIGTNDSKALLPIGVNNIYREQIRTKLVLNASYELNGVIHFSISLCFFLISFAKLN